MTHLAMKVSWDALDQVLTDAVTTTITPCVWMNVPVLSGQTLPMSVYVHLGLLDSTAVSHKYTCSLSLYIAEGKM